MRLILIVLSVICVIFLLPQWFPSLRSHAFFLGEMSIKWAHCIAIAILVFGFKGGK